MVYIKHILLCLVGFLVLSLLLTHSCSVPHTLVKQTAQVDRMGAVTVKITLTGRALSPFLMLSGRDVNSS